MPGKLHQSLVEMFMAAGVDDDTGLRPCKIQVSLRCTGRGAGGEPGGHYGGPQGWGI